MCFTVFDHGCQTELCLMMDVRLCLIMDVRLVCFTVFDHGCQTCVFHCV